MNKELEIARWIFDDYYCRIYEHCNKSKDIRMISKKDEEEGNDENWFILTIDYNTLMKGVEKIMIEMNFVSIRQVFYLLEDIITAKTDDYSPINSEQTLFEALYNYVERE